MLICLGEVKVEINVQEKNQAPYLLPDTVTWLGMEIEDAVKKEYYSTFKNESRAIRVYDISMADFNSSNHRDGKIQLKNVNSLGNHFDPDGTNTFVIDSRIEKLQFVKLKFSFFGIKFDSSSINNASVQVNPGDLLYSAIREMERNRFKEKIMQQIKALPRPWRV